MKVLPPVLSRALQEISRNVGFEGEGRVFCFSNEFKKKGKDRN